MRLAAVCCALFVSLFSRVLAQSSDATLHGTIVARANGVPIARASITLQRADGANVASTRSNDAGVFSFEHLDAGAYVVRASGRGFAAATIAVRVSGDAGAVLHVALVAADVAIEIGRVTAHVGRVDASGDRTVSSATIASDGALRATDALATLPGVTITGDTAAPGGDAYASVRGLRPGESETLLDGHPIGPIGVAADAPDADGTIAGFNFQDAPYFALRDIAVSLGPSQSIGGGGALGGTIDLLTIDPTQRRELTIEQGFGNQGRALTDVRATGTAGKIGYALVSGAIGTYGAFAGASLAQSGLRGTDLTSATLADLTYHVSGDYLLHNDLAKIAYAMSRQTQLTVTSYDATSWADKTGEGDNDFNAASYVLANAPVGASPGCPHGVLVTTDAGSECLAASAYAAAASGPAGGGPGAWQALRNQDYAARLSTTAKESTYAFDVFLDTYAELYHRDASLESGPLDAFLDRWSTLGVRLDDDVRTGKHLAGFDVTATRQTLDGNGTSFDGTSLVANASASLVQDRFTLRDSYVPNRSLSFIANATLARSSHEAPQIDPQAVFEWHASARDTVRIGAARSSEDPSLQTGRTNLLPVGALNPDCGAIALGTASAPASVNVGSAPAANLAAETGTDIELGYARRFAGDAGLEVTAYDANVRSRIATGDFSAGLQLGSAVVAPVLARIAQFCGVAPVPGAVNLTLSRAFNAATARLRGIELSGRVRVAPRLAFDYGYDVQSTVLDDLPTAVLATNPTLVNGVQEFGVPLHKATLGFDATARPGLDLRLEGHFVGIGNPQQLPGYAYADASIRDELSKRMTVQLALANVFGSHVAPYGLVGLGVPYATNAQNAAISAPYVQPFNERYGLAPTTFTLSASAHL